MPTPTAYSYTRYLASKKSVDDRSLNTRVWQGLSRALPRAHEETPLKVLEFGAGIGTMVERLLEGRLLTHTEYKAIDVEPANVDEARHRLRRWAGESGFTVVEADRDRLSLSRAGQTARIEFEAVDAFDFVSREHGNHSWDLLIAQAFLDLVDVQDILPGMLSLLRPGGLCYFTLNFDGLTIFQPEIDPDLDLRIEALYHQTMETGGPSGRPSGGSRTGRHLFAHLTRSGAQLLEVGPSDWVVHPGHRGYDADEAYFLHYIVQTIWEALRGNPELDQDAFARWIEQRHAQVERAELVYIAHQLDFLGRVL